MQEYKIFNQSKIGLNGRRNYGKQGIIDGSQQLKKVFRCGKDGMNPNIQEGNSFLLEQEYYDGSCPVNKKHYYNKQFIL